MKQWRNIDINARVEVAPKLITLVITFMDGRKFEYQHLKQSDICLETNYITIDKGSREGGYEDLIPLANIQFIRMREEN